MGPRFNLLKLSLLLKLLLFVVFGEVAVLAEALRIVGFFGVLASARSLRYNSAMIARMAHALGIYLFVFMGAHLDLSLHENAAAATQLLFARVT